MSFAITGSISHLVFLGREPKFTSPCSFLSSLAIFYEMKPKKVKNIRFKPLLKNTFSRQHYFYGLNWFEARAFIFWGDQDLILFYYK